MERGRDEKRDFIEGLIHAAMNGNVAGVKRMIEVGKDMGIDVNSESPSGYTALHTAAAHGQAEMVIFLITHGANIHAKDISGDSVLHYAARCENTSAVFADLIVRGADIHAKDQYGDTILHEAASGGNTDIIRICVANGLDVNAIGRDGDRPLTAAARNDRTAAVAFLIANGANKNGTGVCGATALHEAALWNHPETVKELIAQGADIRIKDGDGHTALQTAERRELMEVAEVLKAASGHAGRTPQASNHSTKAKGRQDRKPPPSIG